MSSKFFLAFGGDNIIHFDDTIDLGRNFYLISSSYYKINSSSDAPILFINAGIGSDFFGYKGNGFLARTTCFGRPNLTGEGTNFCNWGPIGSIGLAFNDRIAIINEWFGYSYGTGISFRPFLNEQVSFSIFATDYINGFPKYANEACKSNYCETRFYGTISLNF